LKALGDLVESGFGEASAGAEQFSGAKAPPVVQLTSGKPLQGIPLSEGIAVGPLLIYRLRHPAVPLTRVEDLVGERRRLAAALEVVQRSIASRQDSLRSQLSRIRFQSSMPTN
jgi:signal transduction protein with GAF and PtsI domain